MSEPPRVAVIVVTADSGATVERALAALRRQSRPADRVIVADNDSSDGSIEAIRSQAGVELLELGSNLGFAAANNAAVELASDCDWVALLNPDAFPEPDWLALLLEAAARDPQAGSLTSRLMIDGQPDLVDGTGDSYHVSGFAFRRDHGARWSSLQRPSGPVFSGCGAAVMYRRADFLALGGFDERFFCYLEDADLGLRLQLAGRRCIYVSDSVARHVGSAQTGRQSEFTVYHAQRNMVWAWVKNMPGWLAPVYLPQHLLVNLMALAWYSTHGRARAVWRAKRDALLGLGPILRERGRVRKSRSVSPRVFRRALDRGSHGYRVAAGRTRVG